MKLFYLIIVCVAAASCSLLSPDSPDNTKTSVFEDTNLQRLARMFAELPMEAAHLQEVHDAVSASSGQGYDEEYTMDCLLAEPGSGVGSIRVRDVTGAGAGKAGSNAGTKTGAGSGRAGTKATNYGNPLRNLIREYYEAHPETKASADEMI